MAVTKISCGPTKYPDGGSMIAAPGKGINVLDLALYTGAKATTVEITAEGPVEVFLNGEEIKACYAHGDTRRFYHKGEGQGLGGQRFGTIESVEIIGTGKFRMVVTE